MATLLLLLVVLGLAGAAYASRKTRQPPEPTYHLRLTVRPRPTRPAHPALPVAPPAPFVRDDAGEPIAVRRGPRPLQCQACGWFSADVRRREDGRQMCDGCATPAIEA